MNTSMPMCGIQYVFKGTCDSHWRVDPHPMWPRHLTGCKPSHTLHLHSLQLFCWHPCNPMDQTCKSIDKTQQTSNPMIRPVDKTMNQPNDKQPNEPVLVSIRRIECDSVSTTKTSFSPAKDICLSHCHAGRRNYNSMFSNLHATLCC